MDYADCQANNSTPQLFNIQFENMNADGYTKLNARRSDADTYYHVGDYVTHPAFTIGSSTPDDPTDDTELNGLWVAKFETTGTASNPTAKPNLNSLRSQNIATQWSTSQTLRTYQNLSSQTQTFMANNDDWGAVAYLASSIYGAGVANNNYGAVHINANSSYVTGCGPTSATSDSSYAGATTCTPTGDNVNRSYYTTLGRLASTTNNPTGVYDMSGGAWEYTLGNYNKTVNSYAGLTAGSGGQTFVQIPDRYINFYMTPPFNGSYSTNIQKCTLLTCGGQATHETASWNGDYSNFVSSSYPWSLRGGYYGNVSYAGLFDSFSNSGYAYSSYSFRASAGRL
jgi:hypothetical protein